jgi:DNA-binding response OmpR family regulator
MLARLSGQLDIEEANLFSDALDLLAKGDFALVLLDSRLPGNDWVESLATLRSRFPDTPVIMLVGSGDRDRATVALQMGAKDCVVKDKIDSQLLGRIIIRHAKAA